MFILYRYIVSIPLERNRDNERKDKVAACSHFGLEKFKSRMKAFRCECKQKTKLEQIFYSVK